LLIKDSYPATIHERLIDRSFLPDDFLDQGITSRLDVDTKFLRNAGVIPAKDHVPVKEFRQGEIQSEEKLDRVREPAQRFAQALLR
jgi:hypothetical protein